MLHWVFEKINNNRPLKKRKHQILAYANNLGTIAKQRKIMEHISNEIIAGRKHMSFKNRYKKTIIIKFKTKKKKNEANSKP